MTVLDKIAGILLIIGGLNWGLAVFDINAVEALLGHFPIAVKVVYGLVGVSAIYQLFQCSKSYGCCK